MHAGRMSADGHGYWPTTTLHVPVDRGEMEESLFEVILKVLNIRQGFDWHDLSSVSRLLLLIILIPHLGQSFPGYK